MYLPRLRKKQKEHQHSKKALQTCGYPNWAFVNSAKTNGPNYTVREAKKNSHKHTVIPYVAGVSEKLRSIFSKHDLPLHFKHRNTLRQTLVHPKDKTPKQNLSGVVYAVQCSEECADLYTGDTKQQLHK